MRANEWTQQSTRVNWAVRSKRTSEQCKQMSKRTSEWPSTYVLILGYSGPLCKSFLPLSVLIFFLLSFFNATSHFYWVGFAQITYLTALITCLLSPPPSTLLSLSPSPSRLFHPLFKLTHVSVSKHLISKHQYKLTNQQNASDVWARTDLFSSCFSFFSLSSFLFLLFHALLSWTRKSRFRKWSLKRKRKEERRDYDTFHAPWFFFPAGFVFYEVLTHYGPEQPRSQM